MAGWRVPLADVVVPEADIEAVAAVYRSGWLSQGPQTEAFEREFAAHTGAAHAVAACNGTAALHLACLAAGWGPGDEVIVPSLTFVASANAIANTGARAVFADIAAVERPWLSASDCETRLSSRTAGILAVSYGGHPGEIERLRELAGSRGLALVEDAAHAAGARSGERHLGRFGSAGAFSFFSNKNLAVGEGGMAITDDGALAQRMRLLRSHGMTTLTWDRHRGHASGYDVVALGFNYRLDEPRAALGRARLGRLEAENEARRALDRRYRELLAGVAGVSCTVPPGPREVSAHHLFTVVLAEGIDRDRVRAALAEQRVQTSLHYPPAHRFSTYAEAAGELPLTDAYAARAITLPLFAHMTHAQQDLVVESLAGALLI